MAVLEKDFGAWLCIRPAEGQILPMPARELRCDVVSSELLDQLMLAPLPLGIPSSPPERSFFRELYLDTSDDLLQRTGVRCCLTVGAARKSELSVDIAPRSGTNGAAQRFTATVPASEVRAALSLPSEPLRRLAAIVDPRQIETRLELDVERHTRSAMRGWLRRPALAVHFERVKVRYGTGTRSFQQITIELLRGGDAHAQRLAQEYSDRNGLRTITADSRERAQLLIKWMASDQRGIANARDSLALLIIRRSEIALVADGETFRIPRIAGSGVGTARRLLDSHATGTSADPRMLGKIDSIGEKSNLQVWAIRIGESDDGEAAGCVWMHFTEAVRVLSEGTPPDYDSVAAIALGVRAGALDPSAAPRSTGMFSTRTIAAAGAAAATERTLQEMETSGAIEESRFFNSEISILDFNTRVLALAEDLRTPLRERFRFLSIVAANVDEFFMVRVAALKQLELESVEESGLSDLTPQQQLELIESRTNVLVSRQYRCFEACLAEVAEKGVRIERWPELRDSERSELRDHFRDEIFSALTPLAMTLSAGHPFPRLGHLSLSLAVVLLDTKGAAPHFAHVELPAALRRFISIGDGLRVIGVEEVVRANLDLLYPGLRIEQAYVFRVTRGADITLDEDNAWSLLHAVDEASKRRYENPVVRVEVESDMPMVIRELVLKELQREHGFPLSPTDLHEIPGLLDLRALDELEFPNDAGLSFPPLISHSPFPSGDLWTHIREKDEIVHHPFEDFRDSVARFFEDAAADPDVVAIKATLYRAGDESPVISALIAAARAGKDVVAFVELKARFEEERNVGWAKRLQEAGGKMVFGFLKLKTHAKVALVVRREDGKLRRYVHIGTGNYNATTAKRYTDLSLFSADPTLAADVSDLFNELTGSSSAPQPLTRGCLIAPRQLLSALIGKIDREASHARAGRAGLIRMKVNGLSDPEIIEAMYRASQDGATIQLVVRSICTLRPGVPGMSENISVSSVVGRFLEHGRIYHFGNAGEPEFFIGSPDLRPRNLRRRIELVAPVRDPACGAKLDSLLSLYLNDPTAWDLQPNGEYVRRSAGGESAQAELLG
jgi:polyphosphate kinase